MLSKFRSRRLIFLSGGLYFLGLSAFMLRRNIWLSPDQFFIFALVIALFLGMGKKFIRDWSPVILVFLSYEFLRGAVPAIVKFPIHSLDVISVERNIFGILPTIFWQQRLYNPVHLSWYDFLFSLAYMSFFIVPLIVGFYLWLRDNAVFRFFSFSFLILCYMGFITYIVFPTMPPWMAAEKGFLPHINRILYLATAQMTIHGSFPTIYNFFAPNDVAAIPSLHAAVPTLMFFVTLRAKKYALAGMSLLYSIIIYVGIVYLGEHYAVDAIIGAIYAVVAMFLASWVIQKIILSEKESPVGDKLVVVNIKAK